ncbi:SpoIIE family protein phosphatase [Streptomyces sp. NPDC059740]|uniref:SpoIIE family protein phosphatase n=1 Tax=Streptomyces sp. NPDC059740 TaxID=3346926 RepID=UPI00364EFD05
MADRRAKSPTLSLPEDWPAHPDLTLALNGMGGFDWDLDSGLLHVDATALSVMDLSPDDFDGRPESLGARMPQREQKRINDLVAAALEGGSDAYGAYFRVERSDGTEGWAHTQGSIRRDEEGRPRRVIGVIRDAGQEYDDAVQRVRVDEQRRRHTSVVERTTQALAHAGTVRELVEVLTETEGLSRLGVQNLVLGLVEAGRIKLLAETEEGLFLQGGQLAHIGDAYPMAEVVRTLTPRFIGTRGEFARGYPRFWPHIEPLDIGSAVYLPLVVQGRAIGVMGLFYREEQLFTAADRNVMLALGSSIAQSLARATLYDQEHDLAEQLQKAMLPRRIPRVPGAEIAVRYRSARLGRDIGGDWYDVIPLPGGRVAAVIGDVQGHDTQAAAVMGQLRIVLRAYATEGHSAATVMTRASTFLEELDTDLFATCSYVEADLASGVMQIVRAGHVEPLLRHADGICRPLPTAGGVPLGLSRELGRFDYPVTTLRLAAGETLLLFTDGLVERPGEDMEESLHRLCQDVRHGSLEVEQLAESLVEASAGRPDEDDLALLLLRRSGTPRHRSGGTLEQTIAAGDPEGLTAARHMIREAVRAWGAGGRAEEIELVADELITNALLHTEGPARVTVGRITADRPRLRVDVVDQSSALPRRREAGESGVSGRGMLLVDRLADVWGVDPRGGGKCVWCEFDCA